MSETDKRNFLWHSAGAWQQWHERTCHGLESCKKHPYIFDGGIWYSKRHGEWRMKMGMEALRCDGTNGTPFLMPENWDDPRLLVDMMRFRAENSQWWKERCPEDVRPCILRANNAMPKDGSVFPFDPEEDVAWTEFRMG